MITCSCTYGLPAPAPTKHVYVCLPAEVCTDEQEHVAYTQAYVFCTMYAFLWLCCDCQHPFLASWSTCCPAHEWICINQSCGRCQLQLLLYSAAPKAASKQAKQNCGVPANGLGVGVCMAHIMMILHCKCPTVLANLCQSLEGGSCQLMQPCGGWSLTCPLCNKCLPPLRLHGMLNTASNSSSNLTAEAQGCMQHICGKAVCLC